MLKYLGEELGVSAEQKGAWYRHWVRLGLRALETQLYNARRFECDLVPYPPLAGSVERCEELAAFADARPERQADAR